MNSQAGIKNKATAPVMEPSRWQAELTLGFAASRRGVALQYCHHQGPLYVQKPFYPEGRLRPHVYLLHPPGGLVSGDKLQIKVKLPRDTQALISTPGAGRVYRARTDKTLQQQQVVLELAENSTLEWLPLETIIYPGANTRLDTLVKLAAGARFIGWDITCLGLPASAMHFDSGQLNQRFQIELQERIALRERLVLDDHSRDTFTGLAGFGARPVNGLMIAGPFSKPTQIEALTDLLREQCDAPTLNDLALTARTLDSQPFKTSPQPALAGVSLTGEFLLIRYLGHSSEQARKLFTRCWAFIRPELLGIPPCAPRIWAT